jgi:hypothetical protein
MRHGGHIERENLQRHELVPSQHLVCGGGGHVVVGRLPVDAEDAVALADVDLSRRHTGRRDVTHKQALVQAQPAVCKHNSRDGD